MSREPFGTARGQPVERFLLANERGLRVAILTYGGIVQSLEAPDRNGTLVNIVLGFNKLDDYVQRSPYFGALIGRFANRIAHARFSLDGNEYELPANQGPNSLHGGTEGFDKRVWQVRHADHDRLHLQLESQDGDQGYPGNLEIQVTYIVSKENALSIEYRATSDQPTVVNLTNHTYFNLAGEGSGSIEDHVLTLHAERFTPIDAKLIPTGAIEPVAGTALDFRMPKRIGEHLRASHEQIVLAQGFDHNYIVNGKEGTLRPAARVEEPSSGRVLEVLTTEPGLQFYSGNFLDGTLVGTAGAAYRQGDGFTLETQHFPDSPNIPAFPSTLLRPGHAFESTTVFQFGVTSQ